MAEDNLVKTFRLFCSLI